MFYFLAGGRCKGIYSYNNLLCLQFLVCGFLYLVFYFAIKRLLLKDRDGKENRKSISFFFFFGSSAHLVESQFPNQGLKVGHSSESMES